MEKTNWEVWSLRDDGRWSQMQERGNDGLFENKARALAIAGRQSTEPGIVEVTVIERRLIATYNGEAIGDKFRVLQAQKFVKTTRKVSAEVKAEAKAEIKADIKAEVEAEVEEKKESIDGEVRGAGPEEGAVPEAGVQHVRPTDPPGPAGPGAPEGRE